MRSNDLIDEDVNPSQSPAHSSQGVDDSIHEDTNAFQKARDACQSMHCIKRFIHWTF